MRDRLLRPTVYLPAAALALLAAPAADAGAAHATPAPAAAQDTTREQRERDRERERERREAERERRERERERERARREAQREAQNEEREARREAEREAREAEREARDDLGLGDIGRSVNEAVRAGVRGAAEGARAAAEALRTIDEDYESDDRRVAPTRVDTTVSVGREPTVDLSLVSGPVTVTAWDRAEVRVRGESERLPLRFEASGGAVRVYTPRVRARSAGEQRLEVFVPAGARVTASSVSGDVRVRGVRGELEARTTSGDVEVEGGTRRVTLASVSGDVRARDAQGDVRVTSVSGDVTIDGVAGELEARTTSGEVTVRRARLGRLRAESVSGDLAYDGTVARDGTYDLHSHSGGIRLGLPADAGAALTVRTFSGTIDTGVPLTLRPNDRTSGASGGSPRRMEFTLGGGGARVTAESFSGSITIDRPGSSRP